MHRVFLEGKGNAFGLMSLFTLLKIDIVVFVSMPFLRAKIDD